MPTALRTDTYTVRLPQGADPRPLKAFVNAMGWTASIDESPTDVWATMPGQFTDEEKEARLAEAVASGESISHEEVRQMASAW